MIVLCQNNENNKNNEITTGIAQIRLNEKVWNMIVHGKTIKMIKRPEITPWLAMSI